MNINLREEETTEYVSFYQEYLEEVQSLNKKVTDVLNDVMQESKYDKLQKRISGIIDAYMDTVVNDIEGGVFNAWLESKGSLRACLKTYQAGENADLVCAQIENHMGDLMRDILKIEKETSIPTEHPIVSEDGLEQLEDVCRSAKSDIRDIQSRFVSKAKTSQDENDIYGTLCPLFEGISLSMESFFDASLNSFIALHEFVKEVAVKFHNIAEENGIGSAPGAAVNKKLAAGLGALASGMGDNSEAESIDKFRDITRLLYQSICDDAGTEKKKAPYRAVSEIMPIYHKFYAEYGNLLKDRFATSDEREAFVNREYILVTRERNNEQYFNGDEVWTFISHAYRTYTVFDRVADMEKNIADACIKGNANAINLMYGAYVLFTPIMEGYIREEDSKTYSKFSKWASKEILRILGIKDVKQEDNKKLEESAEFNEWKEKNFSEENTEMFTKIVESVIEREGVDILNRLVEKHYTTLCESRTIRATKTATQKQMTHNTANGIYGRYTVTRKSIQAMAPVCQQKREMLDSFDQFYSKKFESLGEGYEKVCKTIHTFSALCSSWGLGKLDISGLFTKSAADSTIQLGKVALTSCTTGGIVANLTAHTLNIFDSLIMPRLKKSKILVRLNKKWWKLTRQDIQVPSDGMMDAYMVEYYGLKNKYNIKSSFPYEHEITIPMEEKHQRRVFESAIFAASDLIQGYSISEKDANKYREIQCGMYLNLIRSGMCSKQDMKAEISNNIVDKLYDIYVAKEKLKPKVELNPDCKTI